MPRGGVVFAVLFFMKGFGSRSACRARSVERFVFALFRFDFACGEVCFEHGVGNRIDCHQACGLIGFLFGIGSSDDIHPAVDFRIGYFMQKMFESVQIGGREYAFRQFTGKFQIAVDMLFSDDFDDGFAVGCFEGGEQFLVQLEATRGHGGFGRRGHGSGRCGRRRSRFDRRGGSGGNTFVAPTDTPLLWRRSSARRSAGLMPTTKSMPHARRSRTCRSVWAYGLR